MPIQIPVRGSRDLSLDPWMTLGAAVRWAAWRGEPEPKWGSVEFEDGTWISHGDLEEQDRQVYSMGAEEVRKALAAGNLEAWAQTGYDEPVQLSKARWSGQVLGSIVSWIEFYHPFDRIIVECARVFNIWPRQGTTPDAPGNGQAPEFDDAKTDWLELWQGPIHFRATYDMGKFGPGHSLERINQYGQDDATGGGRHPPIYMVRLDPDDGATVIEWLIGLPERQPQLHTVRHYHGSLGHRLIKRIQILAAASLMRAM